MKVSIISFSKTYLSFFKDVGVLYYLDATTSIDWFISTWIWYSLLNDLDIFVNFYSLSVPSLDC